MSLASYRAALPRIELWCSRDHSDQSTLRALPVELTPKVDGTRTRITPLTLEGTLVYRIGNTRNTTGGPSRAQPGLSEAPCARLVLEDEPRIPPRRGQDRNGHRL